MKKLLSLLLCISMISAAIALTFPVFAETVSGTCGINVTWEFDSETGTLTISGTGRMSDYKEANLGGTTYSSNAPWAEYASDITTVVIEEGVKKVGGFAFYSCTYVKKVYLPTTLQSIGGSAFSSCWRLEGVYINSLAAWCKVQNIGSNPLISGHNLYLNGELVTDLVIPNGVKRIEDWAFCGGSCFTSVTIPNGVEYIGRSAFGNCTGVETVTIPDSVNEIGILAFSGCSALKSITIGSGAAAIPDKMLYGCSKLESLTIPEGVETAGVNAFYSCSSLRELSIPASLTSFGEQALVNCNKLETITVDPESESFKVEDGVLYSKDGKVLIFAPRTFSSMTIPDGVEEIGPFAFDCCTLIENADIPEGVKVIGDRAFSFCSSLESIVFPSTLETVGDWAFDNCTSLKYSVINADIRGIGWGIFDNCENYEATYFLGTEEQWNSLDMSDYGYGWYEVINQNVYFNAYCLVYGHDWEVVEINPSTYTENGNVISVCSHCGDTLEEPLLMLPPFPGDVNGDRAITTRDVISMKRFLASIGDDSIVEVNLDLNEDGTVTVRDLMQLKRIIASSD